MVPCRLFAATGDSVARLDIAPDATATATISLDGSGAQCVAVDPENSQRVYVGTFDQGVYRSLDGGETWGSVGQSIPDRRVMSVAISSPDQVARRSVVYVGTEPSRLYRSEDDGRSWREFPALPALPSAATWSFPPRPWTHHVRAIALHPTDPATIFVGIELGGVMRTRDGGASWDDHPPGAQPDAHALATHPAVADRLYEAAGGGVAVSHDAGSTWHARDDGMDRHYAWGLAIDATDPDLWYVSASVGARHAHRGNGDARAILYRRRGDAPWEALGGEGSGLEQPLSFMPYALVAPRHRPNALIAGLQHGELALSDDAGETWQRMPTGLSHVQALSEAPMA